MFEPRRFTVGQLFSDSTKFVIPRYQRPYKWGKDEAQELIEDLNNYSCATDRQLFLGTLILEEDHQSRGHGSHQTTVVDGQQRITSLLLLLLACRQQALVGLKDEKLAQTILSKVAYIDPTTGESDGPRLVASESVRDIIEYISESNWKGDFPTKISKKSIKKQLKNVKPVYDVFFKAVQGLDKDGLGSFLRTIYSALIIRIDIDNDEEALSIFERTNARGIELEISDLLKNHLFAKKVEDIETTWDAIVNRADGTLLRMLKYFYVSWGGYILKSNLYRQLKTYAREVGPARMTEDLDRFSRFYEIAREPDSNKVRAFFAERGLENIAKHQENSDSICRSLQALKEFKVTQFIPPAYAIICAIEKLPEEQRNGNEKALVRLFTAFEKLHFINNVVCDRVGNEVERFYADICKEFGTTNNLIGSINSFIQNMSKKRASLEEFEPRFAEISYEASNLAILSYVFDRIMNADLKGGMRMDIYNPNPAIKIRNNNIEHFLAVNAAESRNISKDALNNIGNLLYLNRYTNSGLGNIPPVEKIALLKSLKENEIQNNLYVREFVDKYGSMARDWNEEKIQDRARDMARTSYNTVWNF